MDTPATPPPAHPWQPGDLRLAPSPAWGHARVADGVGHTITILSSHHAEAAAVARAAVEHAGLLAERDRYAAALHRLAGYESDAAVRFVARQALGLEMPDPLDLAAAFHNVETGGLG